VVIVGWVLFRSETPAWALSQLEAMLGRGAGDGLYYFWLYLQPDVALALMAGALASTRYLSRLGSRIARAYAERRNFLQEGQVPAGLLPPVAGWLTVVSLYALFFLAILKVAGSTYSPFIYFRF
jgi:alginate O-acetyltransferase complex protein AlgI